jgi:hypothetical protein
VPRFREDGPGKLTTEDFVDVRQNVVFVTGLDCSLAIGQLSIVDAILHRRMPGCLVAIAFGILGLAVESCVDSLIFDAELLDRLSDWRISVMSLGTYSAVWKVSPFGVLCSVCELDEEKDEGREQEEESIEGYHCYLCCRQGSPGQ